MAECFDIQQGTMNVPIFNAKIMPVRDFIQDVVSGQVNVPANCEKQYIKAVLARLKGAARDNTWEKFISHERSNWPPQATTYVT